MTLDKLTQEVAQFADERDWGQFHIPRSLVLALMAEVGELAEIFQWVPDAAIDDQWVKAHEVRLSEETADVLIYLVRLADVLGIDLLKAAHTKLEQNAEKYPVEKARGNATKYTNL